MTSAETSPVLFLGMSLDMIIGMALGMVASPIVMKIIKIIRHRMKINRMFNEIAQTRHNESVDDSLPSSSSNDQQLP